MGKREWLGKTIFRLIIAAMVCVLIIWLGAYIPSGRAKTIINKQYTQSVKAQASLSDAAKSLADLPAIKDVPVQRSGSFINFAGAVSQSSQKLNGVTYSYDQPDKVLALPIGTSRNSVQDVNSTINGINKQNLDNARRHLDEAKRLLKYNAGVSRALVNLLEYDPAADTAGFSLGTDDTSQRLQLAKDGLSKTLKSLRSQKGKYDDPALAAVIAQVQKLQSARDKLAAGGSIADWTGSVESAQINIISNRQAFWQEKSSVIKPLLNDDGAYFGKLARLWLELKLKYDI